jgi:hypothetical protein
MGLSLNRMKAKFGDLRWGFADRQSDFVPDLADGGLELQIFDGERWWSLDSDGGRAIKRSSGVLRTKAGG